MLSNNPFLVDWSTHLRNTSERSRRGQSNLPAYSEYINSFSYYVSSASSYYVTPASLVTRVLFTFRGGNVILFDVPLRRPASACFK